MSLRRRWFELRRFFRQKSFTFGVFAVCLFLFVFGVAYLHDNPSERSHEHIRPRDVESQGAEPGVWDGELAGGSDPNTFFDDSKLGNYEPEKPEVPSNQPGEHGRAVHVQVNEESRRANAEFGFNTYVSDMISLNRTIPDARMEQCKYWNYPKDLPSASVVIVFHNEGWTPLLRTVHSVLIRSPPHLIKEVVMVDDFSDKREKLDKYIARFGGKVRLVRNAEREGLIRARTIGATHSTADVVIFLDAHCEVNTNWLPPLLAPIKHNRRVMTVPVIDGIDMNTWEYRSVYGRADKHFRFMLYSSGVEVDSLFAAFKVPFDAPFPTSG